MPTMMAALPNIDGALCSIPQSLDDAHYWRNTVEKLNPLKFVGLLKFVVVPQIRQQISAASGKKFTIL